MNTIIFYSSFLLNVISANIMSEGKPHPFALRKMNAGQEIIYNYGEDKWLWRKQVCKKLSS